MLNAWNIGYACCGTTALPKHLSLSTRLGSPLTTLPTLGSAAQQRPSASSCDCSRPCCLGCPLHMAWCIASRHSPADPRGGCSPASSAASDVLCCLCPCSPLPLVLATSAIPSSHPRMPDTSAGRPAPSNCWVGAGSSCRRSSLAFSLPRSCGNPCCPSCWA